MSAFVLHVVRDRRTCVGSVTTRRRIHLVTCKWAGRARHSVRISLEEAQRLVDRPGGRDGRTQCCKICLPYRVLAPGEHPRDPSCVCLPWRSLYKCPVHGPAVRALDNAKFHRLT